MKTAVVNSKTLKSRDFDQSNFGIEAENMPHIFNILSSQLYSDKPLALIREYCTNAIDAHIAAGKPDVPIEVTLPTNADHRFVVRDFGHGLSHKEVIQIYVMYGSSTKRTSNAFTGQKGIGSKCGFAYQDSFQIRSYHNGTLTEYVANIENTKHGRMPVIVKINEVPTDEPSGMEIIVPTFAKDMLDFHEKAQQVFAYFPTKPKVNWIREYKNIDVEYGSIKGKDWGVRTNYRVGYHEGSASAIFANIAYKIDVSTLPGISELHKKILRSPVDIYFPVTEDGLVPLETSANREALEYNSTTKKSIISRLNEISGELEKIVNDKIKKCKTIFDAIALYNELRNGHNEFVNTIIYGGIKWNGTVINSSYVTIPKELAQKMRVFEVSYSKSGRGKSERYLVKSVEMPRDTNTKKITLGLGNSSNVLLLERSENLSKHILRTEQLLNKLQFIDSDTCNEWVKNNKSYYKSDKDNPGILKKDFIAFAFCFESPVAKKDFCDAWNVDPNDFVDVAAYEPIETKAIKQDRHKSKKYSKDVFKYSPVTISERDSDHWEIVSDVDLSEDSGYYIKLNRYKFSWGGVEYGYYGKSLKNIDDEVKKITGKHLKDFGIDLNSNVWGIKPKSVSKLGDGVVSLEEKVKEIVSKYIDMSLIKGVAAQEIHNNTLLEGIRNLRFHLIQDKFNPKSPFLTVLQVITKCIEDQKPVSNKQFDHREFYFINVNELIENERKKFKIQIENAYNICIDNYKLLVHCINRWGSSASSEEIRNYINLVDNSKNL